MLFRYTVVCVILVTSSIGCSRSSGNGHPNHTLKVEYQFIAQALSTISEDDIKADADWQVDNLPYENLPNPYC